MSAEKYSFLFSPIDAVGHFNACIGIAGQLRDRGHKVTFATPLGWKGKLKALGFHEEVYLTEEQEQQEQEQEGQSQVSDESKPQFNDKWGEMMSNMRTALAMSAEDQIEHLMYPIIKEGMKQNYYFEPRLKEIVATVKPDVIVVDTVFHSPALLSSGIPYVLSVSINPVQNSPYNVPPAFSGLPTDGDRKVWESFEKKRRDLYMEIFMENKKWVIDNGGPELKYHYPLFLKYSPYANIYMYPIELDYTMFRPNPPNWHRFDAFVRHTDETFEIPENLKNKPGKLIYFSMGTIGSSELGLMKRLIKILAKSPHRFIVSKGPFADKIVLPDNMWGAKSVPQTKVIPLVDLVITHGGNNTITESFYFGKRVLVLPLFGDQWDNGQRIYETGLGLQFLPYQVSDVELLSGIEQLLKDELLERRMITISKRIQSTNSQSGAADVIENVARNNKVKA
jgi:UDP:flavonoid glycosyltransferase YjiC (YdhE family)